MLSESGISELVRNALTQFIVEPDNRTAFRLLLDELIRITESECGFLGEVHQESDGTPYLQIHELTNIAEQDATCDLPERRPEAGLRLDNFQSLYDEVITTESVVIANEPVAASRSAGLPPGRSELKSFLGCPLQLGDKIIGVAGLANRTGGYNESIADILQPVLAACGMMIHARTSHQQRDTLRRQDEDARRLESLIKLAGNLAHDLNNWLMVIMSTVEAVKIRDEPVDPSTVDVIFDAVQQAGRLSHRMLEFSGMAPIKKSAVDIADLVQQTLNTLRHLAPPQIQLDTKQESRSLIVLGDNTALSQAFSNIFVNAFEAMGDTNEPQLNITISRSHSGTVSVAIADNGPGMTEQQRSRILEPYFSTRGTGRGFGLATVDGIVRAHEGSLQVNSKPGSGACFTISLPATDGLAIVKKSQQPGQKVAAAVPPLLVVDDDDRVLASVSTLLSACGFEVIKASGGRQALELLQDQVVCAVLIDVAMPDLDGLETLAKLRMTQPKLPVVLMSGFTQSKVPQEIHAHEFTEFIRKPFAMETMLSALDRIGVILKGR